MSTPGADDDGSGTMSILEAYRGLISAGFLPKRTVEFHFYSAEVGGSVLQKKSRVLRDVLSSTIRRADCSGLRPLHAIMNLAV